MRLHRILPSPATARLKTCMYSSSKISCFGERGLVQESGKRQGSVARGIYRRFHTRLQSKTKTWRGSDRVVILCVSMSCFYRTSTMWAEILQVARASTVRCCFCRRSFEIKYNMLQVVNAGVYANLSIHFEGARYFCHTLHEVAMYSWAFS